jgi:hypothetical protein
VQFATANTTARSPAGGTIARTMQSSSAKTRTDEELASPVFLAMFWAGGGPFSLPELFHACDWINRYIPTARQTERALNRLIRAGLVNQADQRFLIARPAFLAFERFRKRRRKNRFLMAQEFLSIHQPLENLPGDVKVTQKQHRRALDEYYRLFDKALTNGS